MDDKVDIHFVCDDYLYQIDASKLEPQGTNRHKRRDIQAEPIPNGHIQSLSNCILCNCPFTTEHNDSTYPQLDEPFDARICQGCTSVKLATKKKTQAKRARQHGTYSLLTKADIFKVFIDSDMKCFYCSRICDPVRGGLHPTLDHDYPLSLGGLNIRPNIKVLCSSCHRKKDETVLDCLRSSSKRKK